MDKKLYAVLELILSSVLVTAGIVVTVNIDALKDFIMWFMIGFFGIKILLAVFKQLAYKMSKLYCVMQVVLNGAIIALLAIFYANTDAMAFVVGASCIIDLFSNLIKAIIYKEGKDGSSFFGIENIIYVFFMVLLFMKTEELATCVLFGCVVLYKGVATVLSNMFIRKLFSLSDLGKAVNKVHGLDVMFGLLIIVMLASFILPEVEPSIPTVADAWWYCFALITTLGFGDFAATTVIGRILSVVIGFYGIIIVSLLTSAIVVYINTINQKNKESGHDEL